MEGEIQDPFFIDAEKLERILDNLVSNSLQYTPSDGEINIAVNVKHDRVYYKISDTGSDFSKRDMEKAFEKFYRGDSARTQKDGNSGLGLYISKQLVEKLGGSIKISNTEAGGACVEFCHKIFLGSYCGHAASKRFP